MFANIKYMIKVLNLPVTSIHISDSYIAKTLEENSSVDNAPELYAAVFNSARDKTMFYFTDTSEDKTSINKPFFLCLFGKYRCQQHHHHLRFIDDKNKTRQKFFEKNPLTNILTNEKTDNGKYCIYALIMNKNPPRMPDIIKGLNNHITQEYLEKSKIRPLTPFVGSVPREYNDIGYNSVNFLHYLVNALDSVCQFEKGERVKKLINFVNVNTWSAISPSNFRGTTNICQLNMFINVRDGKYQPFPKEFYFPRFTLDNNEDPQIHKLCFVVVANPDLTEWNILTLNLYEPDLTANHVIKNAYALVYVAHEQDIPIFYLFNSYFLKVFNKNTSIASLKKRLHPKLLVGYYTDDALHSLVMKTKDWVNDKNKTKRPKISMSRYILLSSDNEGNGNSVRLLTCIDYQPQE